jgi:hypothetical protein
LKKSERFSFVERFFKLFLNELILVFYSYKKKHAVNQIQKQKRFVQEILLISKQAQLKMFFYHFYLKKKTKQLAKEKLMKKEGTM